jgi:hypothetical protein
VRARGLQGERRVQEKGEERGLVEKEQTDRKIHRLIRKAIAHAHATEKYL